MTIKEVYTKCLQEGSKWNDINQIEHNKDGMYDKDLVIESESKRQAFYLIASWLEQTEEINPTKVINKKELNLKRASEVNKQMSKAIFN